MAFKKRRRSAIRGENSPTAAKLTEKPEVEMRERISTPVFRYYSNRNTKKSCTVPRFKKILGNASVECAPQDYDHQRRFHRIRSEILTHHAPLFSHSLCDAGERFASGLCATASPRSSFVFGIVPPAITATRTVWFMLVYDIGRLQRGKAF